MRSFAIVVLLVSHFPFSSLRAQANCIYVLGKRGPHPLLRIGEPVRAAIRGGDAYPTVFLGTLLDRGARHYCVGSPENPSYLFALPEDSTRVLRTGVGRLPVENHANFFIEPFELDCWEKVTGLCLAHAHCRGQFTVPPSPDLLFEINRKLRVASPRRVRKVANLFGTTIQKRWEAIERYFGDGGLELRPAELSELTVGKMGIIRIGAFLDSVEPYGHIKWHRSYQREQITDLDVILRFDPLTPTRPFLAFGTALEWTLLREPESGEIFLVKTADLAEQQLQLSIVERKGNDD